MMIDLIKQKLAQAYSLKGNELKEMDSDLVEASAELMIDFIRNELHSEESARHVMKAFYRREHGEEVSEEDEFRLFVAMNTALTAAEVRLNHVAIE